MISYDEFLKRAELEEYDYQGGEGWASIESRCPASKIVYTETEEDGKFYIEPGYRFVNRTRVYFGNDIGLKKGAVLSAA